MVKMGDILSILGKSKAYEVLVALSKGDKSQQDLSFEIKKPLSTVQRALENLEKVGFVESFEVFSGNRRVIHYKLTPVGHQILSKFEEIEELLVDHEVVVENNKKEGREVVFR